MATTAEHADFLDVVGPGAKFAVQYDPPRDHLEAHNSKCEARWAARLEIGSGRAVGATLYERDTRLRKIASIGPNYTADDFKEGAMSNKEVSCWLTSEGEKSRLGGERVDVATISARPEGT